MTGYNEQRRGQTNIHDEQDEPPPLIVEGSGSSGREGKTRKWEFGILQELLEGKSPTRTPGRIQKGRTPNSGFQYSCSEDYGTWGQIYMDLQMPKLMDPILPIIPILRYWAIILGTFGSPSTFWICPGFAVRSSKTSPEFVSTGAAYRAVPVGSYHTPLLGTQLYGCRFRSLT